MNSLDPISHKIGNMEGEVAAVLRRLDEILGKFDALEKKVDQLHSDRRFALGWIAGVSAAASVVGIKLMALLGFLK